MKIKDKKENMTKTNKEEIKKSYKIVQLKMNIIFVHNQMLKIEISKFFHHK